MNRKELLPAIIALKTLLNGKAVASIECTRELRTSCKAALALLDAPIATGDETYIMEFDGASKGNPGPAGLGVVIYDPSGAVLQKLGKALPATTNNMAEYMALIAGLELAINIGIKHLSIKTDSELLVKQLCGEYKIRKPELIELAASVNLLLKKLSNYRIKHIPREMNKLADQLASSAAKPKKEKG